MRNPRRIYLVLAGTAIIGSLLWACCQAEGSLSDCIDATCRVRTAQAALGTGCAFERSGGYVWVLTCHHVVENQATVYCEFWRHGHKSNALRGEVVCRAPAVDAAVIVVPERLFGGVFPKTIPIANRSFVVRPGETLTSVGCAGGTWSTAWQGHALGYSGTDLYFRPVPANGRSGSAIFDAAGQHIVGLLKARTADKGIATSVQALYAGMQPAGLSAGDCQGGLCPRIFGGGRSIPDPGGGQGEHSPPWPGLSPAMPSVPSPSPSVPPSVTISIGDQLAPLVDALKGDSELRRQEVAALVEARKAEAAWYEFQLRQAQDAEHQKIIASIPGEAAEVIGHAVQGDWREAKDSALSEPMLDFGSNTLVWLLTGLLGIGGVFGLAIKFGVPLVIKKFGRMLRSDESTPADDVVEEIARRAAEKTNGTAKGRK